jgi:hypothetical protein
MPIIRKVFDVDPVRTTKFSLYIGGSLQTAESVCGPNQFRSQYLSKADPLALSRLQDEMQRA